MAGRKVSAVRDALLSAIAAVILAAVMMALISYKLYWALVFPSVGVVTFLLVLYYHPSRFYKRVVWGCVGLISLFLAVPGLRAAGFLGESSAFVLMVDSVGTGGFIALCVLCGVALVVSAMMDQIQSRSGEVKSTEGDAGEREPMAQVPEVDQHVGSADRSPFVGKAEHVKFEIHYGEEGPEREGKTAEPKETADKEAESLWPGVSVPLDGPKVSEPFAGREEELKELTAAMSGEKSMIAIVGMAGQGKSCLAGEWFKHGARPPEGVGLFWRKVYEAGYTFDRFLDDLHFYLTGVHIDRRRVRTVEERAAMVEAVLREKPCWVVLDGVERWLKRWAAEPDAGVENLTVDDRAGQDTTLDKFLKGACLWENRLRLLLTTRAVPSALDENPPVRVGRKREPEAKLEDLKEKEAVELFEKLEVTGDKAIMLQAVKAYGCHAYSVHVLGVLIRDLYGGDVLKWQEVNPLEEAKLEGLFERIIENRSDDLGLLELMACSVGPAPVAMLAELLGLEEVLVRRALVRLAKWQMAEFAGGSETEEHTIVRQFMIKRIGKDRVKELRRRMAAWWAEREVPARPSHIDEVRPLLKAVEHLTAAGEVGAATDVLYTKWLEEAHYILIEWLDRFGHMEESIRMNGEVIRAYLNLIEKEGRLELRNDLAMCYNNRGNALDAQGKLSEAIEDLGRAIEIYGVLVEKESRLELRNNLAGCHNNRGATLRTEGKLSEAIADYGRAIEIREQLVTKEGQRELRNDLAMCYNNRGNVFQVQGKLSEAIEDYGRAIEIYEKLVEKEGRRELRNDLAVCYNNLGGALQAVGRLSEAIEDYGRAIEIFGVLIEKESRGELRGDLEMSLFNRAVGYTQRKEWKESRADIEKGGGLLRDLICEGQRHMIKSFMKTAGFRCLFARELGGARRAAEWANDAMRWFAQEVEADRLNEVLLREAAGFADDLIGKAKELLEGGLDEELLERFVKTLKEES